MRILLLAHAFNSLTQRLWVELAARGHALAVELDVRDSVTEEAVALHRPDLVLAPFLKRRIPDSVWRRVRCLVVHPGIRGDRGPAALDWAIQEREREWGVTVIEANGEMDAGDVYAWRTFPMRASTKSSLYRNEVTEAAVACVLEAIELVAVGRAATPLDRGAPGVRGRARPPMRQDDRAIDWQRDDTQRVLAKIRAADGHPGVRDEVLGLPVYLHDAHAESDVEGAVPGAVLATCEGAVLRATRDGGVWIGRLRADAEVPTLKLPATDVLGARVHGIPERAPRPDAASGWPSSRELRYEEANGVGYVHFEFHNGAMSTGQCERLAAVLRHAKRRPVRVIALMGGEDFWSNGIHLNTIEASGHPADASWRNINAIDDVALEILTADRQLTIAAMRGNAGAGGVFLALAADRVLARAGVVLNPHYKGMGNLYGSEYWTYLLPRRVGGETARRIVESRLPVGAEQAAALGLIDLCVPGDARAFAAAVRAEAEALAAGEDFAQRLDEKRRRRAADEAAKPLAHYREEELERMRLNFYGFDPSYHVARYHFVYKLPRARTPLYLAPHRAPRSRTRTRPSAVAELSR
jgi:putative two-component system hydrogenase maturation factor HypX/HoxX